VHGFAGPLGGIISAPHGVVCARLLPYVCQANVQALQRRAVPAVLLRKSEAAGAALARYDEIAQLLTGTAAAQAVDGVRWVQELCEALKVPPLTEFGLKEQDFPTVVAKSQKSSSMKGNPITLTGDELMEILKKASK